MAGQDLIFPALPGASHVYITSLVFKWYLVCGCSVGSGSSYHSLHQIFTVPWAHN